MMVLHEINYKMTIYRDCTLAEIIITGFVVFITEAIFLSLLTRLIFGYAAIGLGVTFISFFHLTKYMLNRLQKIKLGKPYGYYKHLIIRKLSERGIIKPIFLVREGKWSVRRQA